MANDRKLNIHKDKLHKDIRTLLKKARKEANLPQYDLQDEKPSINKCITKLVNIWMTKNSLAPKPFPIKWDRLIKIRNVDEDNLALIAAVEIARIYYEKRNNLEFTHEKWINATDNAKRLAEKLIKQARINSES